MSKNIIIWTLVVVGFCFGQSIWLKENPKINLPMPISSANGTNEITMEKISFYSAQNLSLIKLLSPNVLFMQVEGESLQPKTPVWKQAGIYGLEFVGAECGALICYIGSKLIAGEIHSSEFAPSFSLYYYGIGTLLITPTCTWATGKLLKRRGYWWKSAFGTGVGLGLFYLLLANDVKMSDAWYLSVLLLTPSLGAVVGVNL